MKPSFEVKMTQEALFEFLMFHTYHGIKGILYLVVGVACWIGAIISLRWAGFPGGWGLCLFCNSFVCCTIDLKVQCSQSVKEK